MIRAGNNYIGNRLIINDSQNIFYGWQDSNWSNANNWSCFRVPLSTDNVVIAAGKTVVFQGAFNTAWSYNSLSVQTGAVMNFANSQISLFINTLACSGAINLTANSTLIWGGGGSGANITGITFQSSSKFTIQSNVACSVPVLNYTALSLTGTSTAMLTSDILVNTLVIGNNTSCVLDLSNYNIIVSGNTTVTYGKIIRSGSTGNTTFNGSTSFQQSSQTNISTGIVEFRSGISSGSGANPYFGNALFSTQNQSITLGSGNVGFVNITVDSNITVTNTGTSGAVSVSVLNGNNSSSTFINNATVYLNSTTLPMQTGIFNWNNAGTILGFTMSTSYTIPSFYGSTFNGSLYFSGAGTKTLSQNATIAGNLTVSMSGISGAFDCSSYNLTVSGNTNNIGQNAFQKSGSGNLLFIGLFTATTSSGVAMSGNPNIEFRGGVAGIAAGQSYFGSGQISFTTNNQSFTHPGFTCANIYIDTNITLTGATGSYLQTSSFTGGTGSKLVSQGTLLYQGGTNPFTGNLTFDLTTYANTFNYYVSANQTVYANTYTYLSMTGSGTRTLAGNVICTSLSTVGTNGSNLITLNTNGYNLTVGTGGASIGADSKFVGASGSSLLFIGLLSITGVIGSIDFSANPASIELRGGFSYTPSSGSFLAPTTAYIKFTTNNQSVTTNTYLDFGNPVISGAITVTITSGSDVSIGAANNWNGDNAASTLVNNGNLRLYNTIMPMPTGVFSFSTSTSGMYFYQASAFAIPYGTFYYLETSGSTKTTSQNLVVNGNLKVSNASGTASTLQLSGYGLTVNGTTTITNGTLAKNSPGGSLLFIGAVSSVTNGATNFTVSVPNNEFRNGLTIDSSSTFNIGNWVFTTNNQTVSSTGGLAPITIGSGVTLGVLSSSSNTIDGTDSTSTLLLLTSFVYGNSTQPMLTVGAINTNGYTFTYGSGNQNVKGGTYDNLTFNGGGTKTLQGNVSVLHTYTLATGTTLNANGYSLTNP